MGIIVPFWKINYHRQFFTLPDQNKTISLKNSFIKLTSDSDIKLAHIFNTQNPIPHNCVYAPLEIGGKSCFVYSNSTSKPLVSDLLQNSTISYKHILNTNKPSDLGSIYKTSNTIPKYSSANSFKAQQILKEMYGDVHPPLTFIPDKTFYTTPVLVDNKSKFVNLSPNNMNSDELSKFINTFSELWCSRTIKVIDKFGQKGPRIVILPKTIPKTCIEQNSQNLILTEYHVEHDAYVQQAMEMCGIDKKDFFKYKLFSSVVLRTHLDGANIGISSIKGEQIIHNKYVCGSVLGDLPLS